MKKMIFTAIALVAFSATSMANTIEIKEVEIPVEEVKEVLLKQTCKDRMMNHYEYTMDHDCGSVGCGGDNPALLNSLMALCN